ncbi:hypothetical protein [Brevibacillus porteri]|uniref:Transposase n=2 Tax=Brevibacillus porteri TaxID=2126350 RepID=A0ABX5FIJ8_9BACL|nr:hypothetical protein [Brevibacillus porteri]MED2134929.1 hypothetical protein [Brevibacillus porteri]MED2748436.1 hypothetical protein [Brevibacillus porteri]MED2818360.1 hypothetical protein [Brevibacillus porteri]MED2897681.1 hypothetical protein [Brevibacillus porteri]MED4899286.1 hypothetical protein [Brevibacillus porteri]
MNSVIETPVLKGIREMLERFRRIFDSISRTLHKVFNSPPFQDCLRQLAKIKHNQQRARQLYYRKKRSQSKRKAKRKG